MENRNEEWVEIDFIEVRIKKTVARFKKILSSSDAEGILKEHLGEMDREHFVILLLNTKCEVIGIHTVSIGTLNSSLVHPREVFKVAIMQGSSRILISHNHPSGNPTPSREDESITKRLIDAGRIIGIEVVDHIIIGLGGKTYSFKENFLIV